MDSRSIADLAPIAQARVQEWLEDCKAHGLNILLTCTMRSMETQATLYTYGRTVKNPNSKSSPRYPLGRVATDAKPGQSAHNYGLAVDFVILSGGKADWSGNSPAWNKAIELAEARGLESLRPMESAHLQVPNWRDHL